MEGVGLAWTDVENKGGPIQLPDGFRENRMGAALLQGAWPPIEDLLRAPFEPTLRAFCDWGSLAPSRQFLGEMAARGLGICYLVEHTMRNGLVIVTPTSLHTQLARLVEDGRVNLYGPDNFAGAYLRNP